MGRWIGGTVDESVDGSLYRWIDRRVVRGIVVSVDGSLKRWMDRWIAG